MTIKHWPQLLTVTLFFLLSACSDEPQWVSVYEQCKDQVQQSTADINQSPDAPQGMGNMMQSVGMGACEMIKNTCEKDPQGATCQAIVNSRNDKQ